MLQNLIYSSVFSRLKRETELSPEDMLTILTLLQNEHQPQPSSYSRNAWQNYDNLDLDRSDETPYGDEEEHWLNSPVYPHVSSHPKPLSSQYYYEHEPQLYDKRNLGQWGGFSDNKKKRFMVAKKRSDPTRDLRMLNGPANRNEYYTLAQLLNSQREPTVPVYRRMML